jgi:hypothetical protein
MEDVWHVAEEDEEELSGLAESHLILAHRKIFRGQVSWLPLRKCIPPQTELSACRGWLYE